MNLACLKKTNMFTNAVLKNPCFVKIALPAELRIC